MDCHGFSVEDSTNLEEFAIDVGLVYISLGGAWYFAYVTGIDTGFSPTYYMVDWHPFSLLRIFVANFHRFTGKTL